MPQEFHCFERIIIPYVGRLFLIQLFKCLVCRDICYWIWDARVHTLAVCFSRQLFGGQLFFRILELIGAGGQDKFAENGLRMELSMESKR